MTILSDPPGMPVGGQALNLSGRGLSLLLVEPIAPGTPVRVDQTDRLLLGDVVYCMPGGQGIPDRRPGGPGASPDRRSRCAARASSAVGWTLEMRMLP